MAVYIIKNHYDFRGLTKLPAKIEYLNVDGDVHEIGTDEPKIMQHLWQQETDNNANSPQAIDQWHEFVAKVRSVRNKGNMGR